MADHPTYASCEIELEFGGAMRLFRLPLAQIAALQEETKCGIGALYKRIMVGDFYAGDNVELIRQGLIGGSKMSLYEANNLIKTFTPDMPQVEIWRLGKLILSACMVGYTPEDSKKNPEAEATTTMQDGSTTEPPFATAPS